MQTKQSLRKQLLEKRKKLTSQQVAASTGLITAKTLCLPVWRTAKRVHVYTSKTEWREIGTAALIEGLCKLYPELVIDTSSSAADAPMPVGDYDVIVVPVLGFDGSGYRLGFGLGWYDRFLVTQPQAVKVGLAYAWSKVDVLPYEPHDIPLDDIIVS